MYFSRANIALLYRSLGLALNVCVNKKLNQSGSTSVQLKIFEKSAAIFLLMGDVATNASSPRIHGIFIRVKSSNYSVLTLLQNGNLIYSMATFSSKRFYNTASH